MIRLHIHTLGCPKNEADSGILARRLGASGVALSADPAEASHLLFNTCGFTADAKEESISAVLGAVEEYPNARILVMGCLVQRYREDLTRGLPEVAGWYGLDDLDRLVADLSQDEGSASSAVDAVRGPAAPPEEVLSYAYVKISDGCDHRCSFCAIPGIKGPYRPLTRGQIEEQAAAALDRGARELVLVGQDTTIWREGSLDLAGLVDLLGTDQRLRRVRLMYFQPENVDDRLLALVADHPLVVPYLDVPFQHASRRVLKRMGRRGDAKGYLALLARARELMPDLSLRSTFIVGFPGEDEQDFCELLDFVAEARFDHAGAFIYSPEEGTPAYRLRPRVRAEVARERLGRLSDILLSVAEDAGRDRVGRRVAVMIDALAGVDAPEGTSAVGRTPGQAPEVDGMTFLEGPLPTRVRPGDIVTAIVTQAVGFDLVARSDATEPA